MRRREWTQREMADAVGVHRITVWKWLRGDLRPSLESAAEIETLMGVPVRAWSAAA
jgi:transcriptional regulator with XRE-family HTH domain